MNFKHCLKTVIEVRKGAEFTHTTIYLKVFFVVVFLLIAFFNNILAHVILTLFFNLEKKAR